MTEYVVRFLVGGVVVSAFAMLGDVLRPKSFAGLFAAALVGMSCTQTGLVLTGRLWEVVACGVLGMLLDSYLGARFERRGRLSNNAVNFIGTAVAALAGGMLGLLG